MREVRDETGLGVLQLSGAIHTIDWYFRFRGRLVHKVCHFYLMQTDEVETCPQEDEGITACRWETFADAVRLVSYENARDVLRVAHGRAESMEPIDAAASVETRDALDEAEAGDVRQSDATRADVVG